MAGEGQRSEYEAGMKVVYDGPSQRVIVNFRGRVIVVPGSYGDEHAGRLAGEQHCRQLGWVPSSKKASGNFRSAWD